MQLGMIGLGRMGSNMARRLLKAGHQCIVYNRSPAPVQALVGEGASGAASLAEFVGMLHKPRAIWLMVPAAAVEAVLTELATIIDAGDVLIDGGNSYYHDDIRRASWLSAKGIHYLDVGTSGGVWGVDRGYCLMIGGEPEIAFRLDSIFKALSPGLDAATRTPNRKSITSTAEAGYLHCGPNGAGHFIKMVHNGIEYGLMGRTRKVSTSSRTPISAAISSALTRRQRLYGTPSITNTKSISRKLRKCGGEAASSVPGSWT